jgi:hypothetical protein
MGIFFSSIGNFFKNFFTGLVGSSSSSTDFYASWFLVLAGGTASALILSLLPQLHVFKPLFLWPVKGYHGKMKYISLYIACSMVALLSFIILARIPCINSFENIKYYPDIHIIDLENDKRNNNLANMYINKEYPNNGFELDKIN